MGKLSAKKPLQFFLSGPVSSAVNNSLPDYSPSMYPKTPVDNISLKWHRKGITIPVLCHNSIIILDI